MEAKLLFILPTAMSAEAAGFKPDRTHRVFPSWDCWWPNCRLDALRGKRYVAVIIDSGVWGHIAGSTYRDLTEEVLHFIERDGAIIVRC